MGYDYRISRGYKFPSDSEAGDTSGRKIGGALVVVTGVSLLHRVLLPSVGSFWVVSPAGVAEGGAAVVAGEAGWSP